MTITSSFIMPVGEFKQSQFYIYNGEQICVEDLIAHLAEENAALKAQAKELREGLELFQQHHKTNWLIAGGKAERASLKGALRKAKQLLTNTQGKV